jgi:hypothetical protein
MNRKSHNRRTDLGDDTPEDLRLFFAIHSKSPRKLSQKNMPLGTAHKARELLKVRRYRYGEMQSYDLQTMPPDFISVPDLNSPFVTRFECCTTSR